VASQPTIDGGALEHVLIFYIGTLRAKFFNSAIGFISGRRRAVVL